MAGTPILIRNVFDDQENRQEKSRCRKTPAFAFGRYWRAGYINSRSFSMPL